VKYGTHSYVFIDQWSDDALWILDRARALGLDGVEIGVGDDVIFSTARVRDHAAELGLELSVSPGGLWPLECDLSSDDASERAQGLAWHKKRVDEAAAMGATAYAGSTYGHTGVVKRRRPPEDEYANISAGLHALADYGASQGVTIVIEPMSHFRSHVVNTPQQAVRLVDMADHANLGILLDTYHLVTEITDYAAGIRAVGDRLWGIHACENNRGRPGTGFLPWADIFAAMREIGFEGWVTFETYNSGLGDFAFERGMFHDVCPDPEAYVREGLAFIKAGLAG